MLRLPSWFGDAVGSAAGVNVRSSNALEALVPAASYLSKRFMRQEDSLPPDYFSDAELRRAYLVYFFSTNVLKLGPVLDELERTERFVSKESLRVLDVGTGVGTAVIGLWMWMQRRGFTAALDVTAVDRSADVCAEAERTVRAFRAHLDSPPMRLATRTIDLAELAAEGTGGPYDLITAQNVLIEGSGAEAMIALAQRTLADDGALVLVEPASRYGSRTLLACRDALVEAGFTIYAPCVRQDGCPALLNEGDWCHAISRWERPKFVGMLDDRLGNLRLSLKYSYIIALKQSLNIGGTFPHAHPAKLTRLVSDRIDEKGRRHAFACGVEGRERIEQQKRDVREENKAFEDARRYDLFEFDGLLPVSTFRRIPPEGHARSIHRFNPKDHGA